MPRALLCRGVRVLETTRVLAHPGPGSASRVGAAPGRVGSGCSPLWALDVWVQPVLREPLTVPGGEEVAHGFGRTGTAGGGHRCDGSSSACLSAVRCLQQALNPLHWPEGSSILCTKSSRRGRSWCGWREVCMCMCGGDGVCPCAGSSGHNPHLPRAADRSAASFVALALGVTGPQLCCSTQARGLRTRSGALPGAGRGPRQRCLLLVQCLTGLGPPGKGAGWSFAAF